MDRSIPTEEINRKKRQKVIKVSVIMVALLLIVISLKAFVTPSISSKEIRIAKVERGDLLETITASGIIIPQTEQIITSPLTSHIESINFKAGDFVRAGESILRLNQLFIQIELDRLHDEYELKKNRRTQLILGANQKKSQVNASIKIKRAKQKIAEKDLIRIKTLVDMGGEALERYETKELENNILSYELQQLEEEVELIKNSLQADLKELTLQLKIKKSKIDELNNQIRLSQAISQTDGVITWLQDKIGTNVNTGEALAKVADLSNFKIKANISDSHLDKLTIGQQVLVRVDEKDLEGTISNINPSVENGLLTFSCEMKQSNHPKLRNNLRVDVFPIISSQKNILRIPNASFIEGTGIQEIFVVKNNEMIKKKITVKATNFDFAEIEGLEENEEVIISNTEEFKHYKRMKIKK